MSDYEPIPHHLQHLSGSESEAHAGASWAYTLSRKPYDFVAAAKEFLATPTPDGGWKIEELDDTPDRPRSHPVFERLGDMTDYVRTYAQRGTTLFASRERMRITAHLDYHHSTHEQAEQPAEVGHDGRGPVQPMKVTPGHDAHSAALAVSYHPFYAAWLKQEGERNAKDQRGFVRFLEEHLHVIKHPDAATVMQICLTLEATKTIEVLSSVRQNTQTRQFQWSEEVRQKNVENGMEVPEKLTLKMPIFLGQEPIEFQVLLRWPIAGGKVVFFYDIEAREKLELEAFERLIDSAKVLLPGVPVYWGNA